MQLFPGGGAQSALPERPSASYVNAGVCSRRRGDVASAEDYFQRALKTRPGQPQALYQLADMSFARGDFRGAKAYLNRLTQVAVPNAEMLWLGVRVERRLGDRNAEASYALQLRNKFPDSKEARALAAGSSTNERKPITIGRKAAERADGAPGALLGAAREAQNLSVADVARQLKLSRAQVEALEAGDYEQLPGPVFVRGFIRNYARLLKLDPEPLLRSAARSAAAARSRGRAAPPSHDIPFPTGAPRRWPLYAAAIARRGGGARGVRVRLQRAADAVHAPRSPLPAPRRRSRRSRRPAQRAGAPGPGGGAAPASRPHAAPPAPPARRRAQARRVTASRRRDRAGSARARTRRQAGRARAAHGFRAGIVGRDPRPQRRR